MTSLRALILVLAASFSASWGCGTESAPAPSAGPSGSTGGTSGTAGAGGQPSCAEGALGCACKGDGSCDAPLACEQGKCAAKGEMLLSDPSARACDVLVREKTTQIERVSFSLEVRGTFLREAPLIALSFVAPQDSSIPAGALSLTLNGDVSGLQVEKVHCVNSKAEPLPNVSISFR